MDSIVSEIRGPADSLPQGSTIGVWRHLLEVHADLVEDIGAGLRELHDLSVSEFDVLVNIAPLEAVRHKDLVRRAVLTRSALSRLVDRLCARGLLERRPDPEDQRGVRILLTKSGSSQRGLAMKTNDAIVRGRFSGLDRDDLAALESLLSKLRRQGPTTDRSTH